MPAMILYNVSDNPKKLNKTLGNGTEIQTITPYEPVSDLEGYVIVNYNADYMLKNYAAYLNDYYFITDRELLTGGKMKLHLRMDVLMSFQTDIKNCPCVVSRSEEPNLQNSYIVDNLRNTYAKREVISKVIGTLDYANVSTYTLITTG